MNQHSWLTKPNTGIKPDVDNINKGVGEDQQSSEDQNSPHDDGVIAPGDAADEEAPHAGNAEDGFDDECSSDEIGHQRAEDRYNRDKAVLEGMNIDDPAFAES